MDPPSLSRDCEESRRTIQILDLEPSEGGTSSDVATVNPLVVLHYPCIDGLQRRPAAEGEHEDGEQGPLLPGVAAQQSDGQDATGKKRRRQDDDPKEGGGDREDFAYSNNASTATRRSGNATGATPPPRPISRIDANLSPRGSRWTSTRCPCTSAIQTSRIPARA